MRNDNPNGLIRLTNCLPWITTTDIGPVTGVLSSAAGVKILHVACVQICLLHRNSGKNLFWSIQNSGETLINALRPPNFTLFIPLPHHLIKDKLIDVIERTFSREYALDLACNGKRASFTSDEY